LAGEDAICEAVFRQAGIVRVTTMEELLDSAILLAYEPMPKGDRLAIVTNAGGPGVMATDAAVSAGLEMAHFAPGTTEKLRAVLPAAANMKNPVDVIGDARADRYIAGMRATLDDPNVDELLVILTPQSMTDIEAIAQAVRQVHETATKPIACSFMGAADIAPGVRILQEGHVPHYILPERACRAMAEVQRIRRWRQQGDGEPAVSLPVDRAATAAILEPSADGYLAEEQALAVLRAYGLPVPEYKRCASAEEAVAFADRVGYPVVLRVASPRVVHKTEAQGLMLDLADAGAVRKAFGEMMGRFRSQQGAHASGAIVRKMIPRGHEVILGAKRDTVFGPTLMFGLGGIFVEVFRDVTFELAPIAPEAASRMVRQVKSFAVLKGFRGLPAADVPAIEQSLLRLGQLVSDWPCIAELDINPLIVAPAGQGAWVADVRMRLEKANGSR
jgi:acetyltransferase